MCAFNFITLKIYNVLHFRTLSPDVLKHTNQRCSVCEGQADKSSIQFCKARHIIVSYIVVSRFCFLIVKSNSALTCFTRTCTCKGCKEARDARELPYGGKKFSGLVVDAKIAKVNSANILECLIHQYNYY